MIDDVRRLLVRELEAFAREVELFPDDASLFRTLPGITNSAGNLALHACGNLKHFVGAVLGGTGYVRTRDAEFASRAGRREDVARQLRETAEVVTETLARLPRERARGALPAAGRQPAAALRPVPDAPRGAPGLPPRPGGLPAARRHRRRAHERCGVAQGPRRALKRSRPHRTKARPHAAHPSFPADRIAHERSIPAQARRAHNLPHERPRPVVRGRPGPLPAPARHARRRRRRGRGPGGRVRLGPDAAGARRPRAAPRRGECPQRGERHDHRHRPADDADPLFRRQRHAPRGAALGAGDAHLRLHLRAGRRSHRRLVRGAPRAALRPADGGGRSRRPLLLRRPRPGRCR